MKKSKKRENLIKNCIRVFILIIIIGSVIFAINKSYSKVEVNYELEYANSGDTLWAIAERESKNNKYYKNKDIRYIVYDLKQINNLSSSELKEGQEIKIPNI
ncbi:MAG: LysM peptidoglycan-binding domain-containing protein [Clostridia bacterium]|nr:LysM peptidoglycan-binding domain-containing protein [Clostridia bacterium]